MEKMTQKEPNAKPAVVKTIPSSEDGAVVHCIGRNKQHYLISHCRAKRKFTLWQKLQDGTFIKGRTADSPQDLYSDIF